MPARAASPGAATSRSRRAVPTSTYRLQLTPDFGFAAVSEIVGYLADLGVTHAYLSPILQATPESAHGYDVTDHSRIRAEFGGGDGFRAMARTLRGRGIGIVVDIVPNHMAVPTPEYLNPQLWSVLRDGRGSEFAHWFDIDWTMHEDRVLLPILGAPPEQCLADLSVDIDGPDGAPVLRYFDHVLPLWPGTARLPLTGLIESQHYKLAYWRDAATDLNWRRFFDITTLIGVRVEERDVFDATHEVVLRLAEEGLIDGLRVDHPDGLADPRGYFRRLAEETGGMWVVAEKILSFTERLPGDWPVAGTTGYDLLGLADGLFVDPAGSAPLSSEYTRFACLADPPALAARFADVAAEAKREVTTGTFGSEVRRLGRLLARTRHGTVPEDRHRALTELLAAFEVYRAYAHPGETPSAQSSEAIGLAVATACDRLPGRLHPLVTGIATQVMSGEGQFSVLFQQCTGAVLAKGVEDTAFYRWPRLLSLNEVGGDPDRFGVSVPEFHAHAARLWQDWPGTMTTLSTHDTKRQEDVRARLAVLSEIPAEWAERVADWHARAIRPRAYGASYPAVDPDTEYLIWQTLVGAWPMSGYRLTGYLTKAIREAKRQTSWTDPDGDYEAAVLSLAAQILGDGEISADITAFTESISPDAMANSLGVKLIQLTMPGVADIYQGCELAGLSLVDPDNRRPVDYERRRGMLTALKARPVTDEPEKLTLDSAKLLVTSRALGLRRARPDWFTGPAASYEALSAQGPAADHVVAFRRGGQGAGADGGAGGAITVVTRLPVGLRRLGGWTGTTLPLPAGGWRDVLTGTLHDEEHAALAALTRALPVALLVPARAGELK